VEIRIIARSLQGQGRQEAVVSLDHPVILGRDPGCPLTLFGEGLSRRHFLLEVRGGEVVIVDQSVNGTKVNDKWVPRGEPFPVKPGDVIELPNYQVTFEGIGSPSASSTVVPAEPDQGPPQTVPAKADPRSAADAKTVALPPRESQDLRRDSPAPVESAEKPTAHLLGSFTWPEYLAMILTLAAVLLVLLYLGT